MKKFNLTKSLLAGAMVALLAVGVQSCKKDDDPLDREQFIGSYNSTSPCVAGASWTTTISESASGDDKIVVGNLGDVTGLDVTATVVGTGFTISSQTDTDSDGDTWTISGAGSISGNTVTATISYTYSGTTFTCAESWNKQ